MGAMKAMMGERGHSCWWCGERGIYGKEEAKTNYETKREVDENGSA